MHIYLQKDPKDPCEKDRDPKFVAGWDISDTPTLHDLLNKLAGPYFHIERPV